MLQDITVLVTKLVIIWAADTIEVLKMLVLIQILITGGETPKLDFDPLWLTVVGLVNVTTILVTDAQGFKDFQMIKICTMATSWETRLMIMLRGLMI